MGFLKELFYGCIWTLFIAVGVAIAFMLSGLFLGIGFYVVFSSFSTHLTGQYQSILQVIQ